MRLIYHNDWDLGTLTESQEDSSYPVENTQDIRLVKTWRTSTASASTIVIDAGTGSTYTCNCCAILNHNFTASAGIFIQASTAATWATAALSAEVTYRADTMVLFFTNTTGYRYWRFSFDELTNSDTYYEVGRLFLGTYVQVSPASLVEFPVKHVRNDRTVFSKSNQLYGDQGVGWKELHYKFPRSSNSAKTLIETMWGSCGKYIPLIFLNYNLDYTIVPPLYCVIQEDIIFEHLKNDFWSYSLSLRECS